MSDSIPTASTLPAALTERDQWLCWRSEERDGKLTKIPVNPHTGRFGSTTKSSTWSDFSTASDRAQTETIDGLGFVFTDDDPIVGVDLDACRIPETGKTREWAEDIIDRLDSFTEVSPSGTGYHVLVEGSLPGGRNRKGDVELYETGRFFTVTGEHVERTPETVESRPDALESVYHEYLKDETEQDEGGKRDETESSSDDSAGEADSSKQRLSDDVLLERAQSASNSEKFTRLYRGRTAGYESNSEADMALCALLAFWTGGNSRQIDRIFRTSGLYRDKWDEPHFADGSTYGEKTIERAIAGTSEFYEPPAETDESVSNSTDESSAAREIDAATGSTSSHQTDSRSNQQPSFEHETDYLDRLETLESELQATLDEADRLRDELERERTRRRELEAELESIREMVDEGEGRWWIPW